jgi:hypothetical protein
MYADPNEVVLKPENESEDSQNEGAFDVTSEDAVSERAFRRKGGIETKVLLPSTWEY